MKILLLCGSPRPKGNSAILLKEVQRGIEENIQSADCEYISTYKLDVSPCLHCDKCKGSAAECIQKDDTNAIIAKVEAADVLIFSSPVYWGGISAKLKLILDKFYSRVDALQKCTKKMLVLSVGGGPLHAPYYSCIQSQFECSAEYLQWEHVESLSFSAYDAGEIAKDKDAMQQAYEAWQKLI